MTQFNPLHTMMVTLLTTTTCSASAWSAAYTVVDLGALEPGATAGPGSLACAVTDDGRIAGFSVLGDLDGVIHGYVWSDGALTDLPPLPADDLSIAVALDGAGRTIGVSYVLGALETGAVRWTDGTAASLGDFEPVAANDAGVVVGLAPVGGFGYHRQACRLDGATLTILPSLGGRDSIAHAIGDDGRIVGASSTTGDGPTRAVLWQGGSAIDLGTLGGPASRAHDLNANGVIVGAADLGGGGFHACRFVVDGNGTVQSRDDLGELGAGYSAAYAVNDAGTIVGVSDGRAFVHDGGAMSDLNALIPADAGWALARATDINAGGWIVGAGAHDGAPRAFLLIPTAPADLNGDGVVDFDDLLQVLGAWGPCAGCPADLDGDGMVGLSDLIQLLAAWD